jgi:hypothetical protein
MTAHVMETCALTQTKAFPMQACMGHVKQVPSRMMVHHPSTDNRTRAAPGCGQRGQAPEASNDRLHC